MSPGDPVSNCQDPMPFMASLAHRISILSQAAIGKGAVCLSAICSRWVMVTVCSLPFPVVSPSLSAQTQIRVLPPASCEASGSAPTFPHLCFLSSTVSAHPGQRLWDGKL